MNKPEATAEPASIPAPPHPHRRNEPLPGQAPKSSEHDPGAPERIKRMMANPSYLQADHDVQFLNRYETRGVRLQIDYLKPEYLLEQHGIGHTIVVFGSTRIEEPSVAAARAETLRARLAESPEDDGLRHRLEVAERLEAKSRYYTVAREFGQLVGEAGHHVADGELLIMTGGGPGIMEAANRGAYDASAKSIGLNISLPHEQFPNPYITPDLCFRFHYFSLRKLHFLLRTRALVVFPGGYGTCDELFETLTLVQTRKIRPIPVILVGEAFWRRMFDVDFMVEEGVIDAEDRDLFWYAETAEEIWAGIRHWHQANGTPLIPGESPEGE